MTITDALVVAVCCYDPKHPLYVEAKVVLDRYWAELQQARGITYKPAAPSTDSP